MFSPFKTVSLTKLAACFSDHSSRSSCGHAGPQGSQGTPILQSSSMALNHGLYKKAPQKYKGHCEIK